MAEPAEGQVPAGDFQPVPDEPALAQSIQEIAAEVIAGRWGRGNARKARLEAAGFDPVAVNEEVTKIFKGNH